LLIFNIPIRNRFVIFISSLALFPLKIPNIHNFLLQKCNILNIPQIFPLSNTFKLPIILIKLFVGAFESTGQKVCFLRFLSTRYAKTVKKYRPRVLFLPRFCTANCELSIWNRLILDKILLLFVSYPKNLFC
jgi:hypothetical protein